MVAGATGIDLYLMTVAADDGVMPQTREHAAVLRALGVTTGVVAVTKADLTDPETAMLEASELLPDGEAVAVSAKSGAGLDDLRAALDRAARAVRSRADAGGETRLHVDRVFTIKGAGTVVTGTLWAGALQPGDELVVLPEGRRVRARGVQVHDAAVDRAAAGQRVAVNLTGAAVAEIARGDVLVAAGSQLRPSYLLDARLEFDGAGREPDHGERVQVHHGTRESAARLAWLGGPFWQVRLEQPVIAAAEDRVVIRQIAPPDTLGGGVVLDPTPRKHGPSRDVLARLERLARGEPAQAPTTMATETRPAGPPADRPNTPAPLSTSALATEERLRAAAFEPPLDSELDADDLAALRRAGRAVRVSKALHYHPDVLAEVRRRVIDLADSTGGAVTLAQVRDELGTSRKFAQALLEHLDSEKVTIRRGDQHVVRARAR
jgi:selenocysteine-specific elongation factor